MATLLRMTSGMLLAALAAILTASPLAAQSPHCDDLTLKNLPKTHETRALAPMDLVRLRDIGSLPDFHEPVFALSPDRQRLAFQIRQADPETNGFCLGMIVMAIRPGARPITIDSGSELILWRFADLLGKSDFPSGFAKVITPQWFPDGRSIAFLKRVGPVTQIWRAYADGSGSAPLSHSDTDVEDFRITADGQIVIFSSRPALAKAWTAIAREGLSGFHYDDRFAPNASSAPFPAPPISADSFVLDLTTSHVRPASDVEAAMLSDEKAGAPREAVAFALSPTGRRAWTRTTATDIFPPHAQLVAEDDRGREIVCTAESCRAVGRWIWWSGNGQSVRFIRHEDWGKSATAVYEWTPGTRAPRRLYVTQDLLVDCQPLGDDLICAQEGSLTPRRLNLIHLATGRADLLLDLNPELQHRKLGRVERLRWKNAFGTECFGDLVLPVGYRTGVRYPLIVVQYSSRGFLRGGTGDEYPIQAFANRGYAVLSIERPASPTRAAHAKSYADLDKADLAGFIDRKNVLSAIETAVTELIDRGIVDQRRVGITGLSDGTTTVQFAGLHSHLFSAAAMSGCCWERSQLALLGPVVGRQYAKTGWPLLSEHAPGFWSEISWAQNPRVVPFPVLLQLSDSEFRSSLEAYTALNEVGAPIDMYVFPGEPHVKWQPAHRLAIYERNLDWFDFWLKDIKPGAPVRAAEVARWEAMKQRAAATHDGETMRKRSPG